MWSMFLLAYAVIVTIYALIKKISLLAILLFYAEHGNELPDNEQLQQYAIKACKKLFHIPN